MKTIQLENSKEKHFRLETGRDEEMEFKDKSLLKQVINIPVQGINLEEMKIRLRILDKIDAATDKLELEDADFEHLKKLYTGFPFQVVSKHVVKLGEKFSG